MPLAVALLLLLAMSPLVVALMRANELFYLRLRGGGVRVARGRIPQALLNDIADVLRDPPVAEGAIRGVSEDGRARLYPECELSEGQRQRLRNVVARWPVATIRAAPRRR
jgi:Protein of unknown function (DUF3634)